MSFYAEVRKADDLVESVRERTPEEVAGFPSGADTRLIEITQAQFGVFESTGKYYDGSSIFRYKWVDPNFIVQPDPRPIVTFTPAEIKAEIGGVVTVQINHSGGLDGLQELLLVDIPTRVVFVAGVAAAVVIDTSEPNTFFVRSQQAFKVPVPLHVTVYSRKIGPAP